MSKKDKSIVKRGDLNGFVRQSLDFLESDIGGRQRLIEALIATGHPSARKFIAILARSDGGTLSLYEACRRARIEPEDLVHVFVKGDMARQTASALLKLSEGLPGLVDHTYQVATQTGPSGHNDRALLLKMAGLVKPEGGVNINQQFVQNVGGEGFFERMTEKVTVTLEPEDIQECPENPKVGN